jgi:hypothetical protein
LTFQEIATDILDTLNLTSDEAATRVLRTLHRKYKEVTSAIGLIPSRRTRVSQAATIGNRDITFASIEKIDSVFRIVGTKVYRLDEITNEEMLEKSLVSEPATKFCIRSMTGTSVTVRVNVTPTTTFTLYAEGLTVQGRIAPDDTPAFPESFHDILIYGVLAEEYRRKEQKEFFLSAKSDYDTRLSDLKFFIAKTAYMTVYEGKDNQESLGWWDTNKA